MAIGKTHLASLAVAGMLAAAIPVFAQGLNDIVQRTDQRTGLESDPVPTDPIQENRYRIGLDCVRAPEFLQLHLRLPSSSGLLVNGVMDNSPAGRAGMKRYDVVVEANGRPVGTVADLVREVNLAKSTEMTLQLIREGEPHTVKLTPEERDEEEIARLRNGFADQLGRRTWPRGLGGQPFQDQLDEAMRQFQLAPFGGQFGGQLGNGWQRIRPGIILDENSQSSVTQSRTLPDGTQLSIQIDRKGTGPASIVVERGDDRWELTENDLDKLPEDLRATVRNTLNGTGTGFNMQGLFGPNAFRGFPVQPAQPIPGQTPPRTDGQLEERFDGLELRVKELRDAIKSLQGDGSN